MQMLVMALKARISAISLSEGTAVWADFRANTRKIHRVNDLKQRQVDESD